MDQSNGLGKLMAATAAGTMIGISTMFMMQNKSKLQVREQKLRKIKERKNRLIQNKMINEFLVDQNEISQAEKEKGEEYAIQLSVAKLNKQHSIGHRVELCFDENDEMIE